jgi:hypothetical protein
MRSLASLHSLACWGLLGAAVCGCEGARSAHDVQGDNPLGPSFWLVPTPSEDAALLGRTFARPPDTALSLEEQSQPNPCEAELSATAPVDMRNHYENAIDVSSAAYGKALLGVYGFSGDAASASHLLYKVSTAKKLTRLDTTGYVECCKTHDCGWGYVSALVYGEGEYVSARSAKAGGVASYQLLTAQGKTSYQALERKQIRGWLAAVITAHDRQQAARACPADQQWQAYECVSKDLIAQVRQMCAVDGSQDPFWKDNPDMQYNLKEQRERACRWLDDHRLR